MSESGKQANLFSEVTTPSTSKPTLAMQVKRLLVTLPLFSVMFFALSSASFLPDFLRSGET